MSGAAAECRKISDGDPTAGLTQMLSDQKERIVAVEKADSTLAAQTKGLIRTTTDHGLRVEALETQIKTMAETIKTLQSSNTKLVTLLKSAFIADDVYPAPSVSSRRDAPGITADGNALDVVCKELTLNGDHVASADETKAMIKAAVSAALNSIADQL